MARKEEPAMTEHGPPLDGGSFPLGHERPWPSMGFSLEGRAPSRPSLKRAAAVP